MRTALITGTSSGFGLSATITLAQRGWRVVATMRDLSRRHDLERIATEKGVRGSILIEHLDVTDSARMSERVGALMTQIGGRLDAVVNNAGVAVAATFEDLPPQELRRIMDTNFFGALDLTRELLPHFRHARRGRVLFVSSNSAFAGEPTNSIYCASKFALEGFAESLAYEVQPFGIDIILVEPAEYRTAIWRNSPRLRPAATAYGPFLDTLWPAVDRYVERHARDPQEVADTIAMALEARKPKFRYPVGPTARIGLALRGKVPAVLMRWSVSRFLGLNKVTL